MTTQSMQLTHEQLDAYRRDGYLIVRGLWTPEEVEACRRYFDGVAERGEPVRAGWPGAGQNAVAWSPVADSNDPLKRYPRWMHPHYTSELAMRMLIDPRIGNVLRTILDDEPLATQSMYYFKPPGGRGQALHQDNYYLRVKPDSCIAAWTAVDRSHPDNGGLWVVPGTQDHAVQCPELADPEESFTTHFVRPPDGKQPVPAKLEPGDVLFFNGSVVHGSRPNTSTDWRRSFICHYMPARSTHISDAYGVIDFDGRVVSKQRAEGGGPCGVEFRDGQFPSGWEEARQMNLQPVRGGSIPG